MKQEPIRFDINDGNSARSVFEELRRKTKVKCAWLVESHHWASEGYWIEFQNPRLSRMDSIVDSFNL